MTKLALLIGINYFNTQHELGGCINDVHNLKKTLVNKFSYQESNIQTLTDDENSESNNYPTGNNIKNALENFIKNIKNNNVKEVWISYSGHGTNLDDISGDENDNKDEAIVPVDYQNGMITDDLWNKYMQEIPETCHVTCLFDCCHSGTMSDLKYNYKYIKTPPSRVRKYRQQIVRYGYYWKRYYIPYWVTVPSETRWNREENTNVPNIKCSIFTISGCKDNQTSADVYNTEKNKWGGALTNAFIETIDNVENELSCIDLCKNLNNIMINKKYSQRPMICCNNLLQEDSIFIQKRPTKCFILT